MTAEEYYQKGNEYRKQELWHEAINCYIQAIELDPDSPAVEAKRMLKTENSEYETTYYQHDGIDDDGTDDGPDVNDR